MNSVTSMGQGYCLTSKPGLGRKLEGAFLVIGLGLLGLLDEIQGANKAPSSAVSVIGLGCHVCWVAFKGRSPGSSILVC